MDNIKGNRIAVIGATGYGGLQSIRILRDHPFFKINFLGGERSEGKYWNEISPFLPIEEDIQIKYPDPDLIADTSDFVILGLPNGLSSQLTPKLLKRDLKVIDLSADYRFKSLTKWSTIYSTESSKFQRNDSSICDISVYGLPELFYEEIKEAKIVAAPGCFPTASLLPLLPFLKQGLIETEGIIIDSKSGTSGGGRLPKENLLLSEASESICPYGVIGHRHTPEIEEIASEVSGREIQLQFTPHLIPMVRGILSTIYSRLRDPGLTAEDCKTVLETFYRMDHGIEILPVGIYPATKWSKYTNKAYMSVQVDKRNGGIILMSSIDNLLKGQAGQAIQCLNIMAKLDKHLGLPLSSFYP